MKEKIIVALDYSNSVDALKLVDQLDGTVLFYKVGMQLFYKSGFAILEELKNRNKKIFLDLKLHDIPNTVAGAIESLSKWEIEMLTVHASGGRAMLEAAAQARASYVPRMEVLAVTVLTHLGEEDAKNLGWRDPVEETVNRWAQLAQKSGLDGVVASSYEVEKIKLQCGAEFKVVTPGIRPVGYLSQDQNRIATPKKAILAGSDHLIIGRPITQAKDPQAVAEMILKEMGEYGISGNV